MVRLLQAIKEQTKATKYGFNPTMVRLLLWMRIAAARGDGKFQSHNGAIAAQQVNHGNSKSVVFQSHNGAIAACKSR